MKLSDELKGHYALFASRIFSGLNMNALKFLLPLSIAPLSCVTLRLLFGSLLFWIIGIFEKPDLSTVADRVKLFFIGAVLVFGYMLLYAVGINYTTPVNFAILNATQPIWVFLLSVLFLGEKITSNKVAGIIVAFLGAILCLLSQPDKELASNPLLGNILAVVCSLCYAFYLIFTDRLLSRVSNMTMLRYTFLGATLSSLVATLFWGFDAPMFVHPHPTEEILVLLYVLIFPTAVSYLLVPIGLKYLKPTVVSIYGYLTLFIVTLTSVILGQDKLNDLQTSSLALICLGIFWVSTAERKSN